MSERCTGRIITEAKKKERLEAQLHHWKETLKKAKISNGNKRDKSRKTHHAFNVIKSLEDEIARFDRNQKRRPFHDRNNINSEGRAKEKEYWVSYQYNEIAQEDTLEYQKKLEERLKVDLASLDITGVEIIEQKIWPYFSHFDQEGINKGYPWEIIKMQGMKKTWYAGASCVFESVDDVFEYNHKLINHLQ